MDGRLAEVNKQIRMIVQDNIKNISFFWFLAPVVVALVSFWVVMTNMPEVYGFWRDEVKAVLETIALVLMGAAFLFSLLRVVLTKGSAFSIWLSTLVLILLCREIHWDWTSNGVYIGVFFWAAVGVWKYSLLKEALSDRKTITLLALVFFSYFVGVTFDQQWWTEAERMDKIGKLAGEVVEDFGHICICMLLIVSSWRTKRG